MTDSSPAHGTKMEDEDLSSLYWNVNLPPSQWTKEPPPYLADLSDKDRGIISTRDCDFSYQRWDAVRDLIFKNQLERFQRLPSDLRRYLKYNYDLKRRYGSVLKFVQHERLHWHDTTASGEQPFANPSDYKILYNDWPYALEPSIVHLVVWVKFELESDETTDDLTDRGRKQLEDFVTRTFCSDDSMPRERVIWFKNWRALKSIHALEHFHVLLYEAPVELVERLTQGDKPMSTIRKEEEEEEGGEEEEEKQQQLEGGETDHSITTDI